MNVIIGISDLGGFGDVVSSIKIGEALQAKGHQVSYYMDDDSQSLPGKLNAIFPDLAATYRTTQDIVSDTTSLRINVVGPILSRPDIYVSEFNDECPHFPLPSAAYICTGVSAKEGDRAVLPRPVPMGMFSFHVPMFYAPYRKAELPEPGEEDIRSVITGSVRHSFEPDALKAINNCEMIGVCYTNNEADLVSFSMQAAVASAASGKRIGIVAFQPGETEHQDTIMKRCERGSLSCIATDGSLLGGEGSAVTVIMLPSVPQTVSTRILWASEMPNVVTGDHSLSDAMHALAFGNGQGFIYEMNRWKHNLCMEMASLIAKHDASSGSLFYGCTDSLWVPERYHSNLIASVLAGKARDSYAEAQRSALQGAIRLSEEPELATVQGAVAKLVGMFDADPGLLSAFREESHASAIAAMTQTQVPAIPKIPKKLAGKF